MTQDEIRELTEVMRKIVRQELADLEVATRLTVNRGVVDRVNNDGAMQELTCTALADETLDEVEHFEGDGFTSIPAKGSETCLLTVGDDRSHVLALGTNNREKRKAAMAAVTANATPAAGDTITYGPDGQFIHMVGGGDTFSFCRDGAKLHLGTALLEQPAAMQDKVHALVELIGATITTWANALPAGPVLDVDVVLLAQAIVLAVHRPTGIPPGANLNLVGATKVNVG